MVDPGPRGGPEHPLPRGPGEAAGRRASYLEAEPAPWAVETPPSPRASAVAVAHLLALTAPCALSAQSGVQVYDLVHCHSTAGEASVRLGGASRRSLYRRPDFVVRWSACSSLGACTPIGRAAARRALRGAGRGRPRGSRTVEVLRRPGHVSTATARRAVFLLPWRSAVFVPRVESVVRREPLRGACRRLRRPGGANATSGRARGCSQAAWQ